MKDMMPQPRKDMSQRPNKRNFVLDLTHVLIIGFYVVFSALLIALIAYSIFS